MFDRDNPVPAYDPGSASDRRIIWYEHGKAKRVIDQLVTDLYPHEQRTVAGFSGSLDELQPSTS
ncbi:hypothetical protein [Actinokineospora sp.]|uniref:hypothetical protein n=1 Tax=Actinokineospora sp. TaxID=1872133 RepID=UPI004037DB35